MKFPLFLLTGFLGIILAVHLGMNGKVGAAINNARVANAVFWCIGAATAVIIGLSGWQAGALGGVKQVNPLMLTAGAMGACLVFGIAWLIPRIGGAPVMTTLIAGQMLGGLVMSQLGVLGSPLQPISMIKAVGVIIMLGGVALINFSK